MSTVILGASRVDQVRANLTALEVVERLTPEVMKWIEGVLKNEPAGPQRW